MLGITFVAIWSLALAPFSSQETGFLVRSFKSPVTETTRQYAVYVPERYFQGKEPWPVIVFLHGRGESGDDIELVRKHGPIQEAMSRPDFPFLVVAPQCPRLPFERVLSAWREHTPDVLLALDEVKAQYRVDSKRIYLTGLSMGGFGAFQLAADHPDLFAAVAPVCGGSEQERVAACRSVPFWIFHGEQDPVVPVSQSTRMAEAMKAQGMSVKLTVYPGVFHDSWTPTYSNPELYAWFLIHRRP